MRIGYASDLHLEFDPDFRLENEYNVEVLILAGDICVASDFLRPPTSSLFDRAHKIKEFFKDVSNKYPMTYYVMGNHEHYHGIFSETHKVLEEVLKDFDNIVLLRDEAREYKGVVFYGTTLWTDFKKSDPHVIYSAKHSMNDYRQIAKGTTDYRKIVPEFILEKHIESKGLLTKFLERAKERPEDVVIITHHAPSEKSIHPKYKNDTMINSYYFSDLEEYIKSYPSIRAWVHGHVHSTFDYMIGDTRILTNPKGYLDENINFDPEAYFHI